MTSEPAQSGIPKPRAVAPKPLATERVSDSSTDSGAEPISEPEPPPARSGGLRVVAGPRASRPAIVPSSCASALEAEGGCTISLQNPNRYAQVAARKLRPWAASMVAAVAPDARSLAVRFISDRAMRDMNLTYRGQDKPTDVLSFPGDLGAADDAGTPPRAAPDVGNEWPDAAMANGAVELASGTAEEVGHLGDIAIAVPTAERQARAAGHGLERELRTLMLHGLLHCLGYDHEADDGTMERLETRLRRQWLDHA